MCLLGVSTFQYPFHSFTASNVCFFGSFFSFFELVPRITPLQIKLGTWSKVHLVGALDESFGSLNSSAPFHLFTVPKKRWLSWLFSQFFEFFSRIKPVLNLARNFELGMYIRVEREKKNIPRILTKFGGVVGSLSETTRKNLSSLGGAGRKLEVPIGHLLLKNKKKNVFFCFFQLVKMTCDLWNCAKNVQFEFLHLFEPPSSFSDQNFLLPRGQKVADRKNREVLFFKKTLNMPIKIL